MSVIRRTAMGLLMTVMMVVPSFSFAHNATAIVRATSCCDKMSGDCGGSASPTSCCKTTLIQVESRQHLTAPLALRGIAVGLPCESVAAIDRGFSLAHTFVQATHSPPPKPTKPLNLRI